MKILYSYICMVYGIGIVWAGIMNRNEIFLVCGGIDIGFGLGLLLAFCADKKKPSAQ